MNGDAPRFCHRCGYDLGGITADVCPECGCNQLAPGPDEASRRGCASALIYLLASMLALTAAFLVATRSVVPIGPVVALGMLCLALLLSRAGRQVNRDL